MRMDGDRSDGEADGHGPAAGKRKRWVVAMSDAGPTTSIDMFFSLV
jgi:hypothetical protein